MKKLFAATVMISALFACNPETEITPPSTAFLSGLIEEPAGDIVILSYLGNRDSANVDSTGYFQMEITLENATYAQFHHGREYTNLYLSNGDSLHLTLNTNEFDKSLKYTGHAAVINNYLAEMMLLAGSMGTSMQELYALELPDFDRKIDSVRTVKQDHLDKLVSTSQQVSEKFIDLESGKYLYEWAMQRINYPQYHQYVTRKDSLDLGEDFDDYLTEVSLEDSSLLSLTAYTGFLKAYIDQQVRDRFEKDSTLQTLKNGYFVTTFETALSVFSEPKVKEKMLYTVMSDQLRRSGKGVSDSLMKVFKANCPKKEYVDKVDEYYQKWIKLAEGMPAPGFAYRDIDSNVVSLDDFKGKYVYIDVWATWCGPCKQEIPHLEKLQEEFKDKNIVFVSISIDNSPEPWHKMVREDEMKGIHLYAEGAWKSDLTNDYVINSIPRFILISPEGKLVDVNAPRPSGAIAEILKGLDGVEV